MPVRSKRAAGPVVVSSPPGLVYTVPAGETFRGIVMMTNNDAAVPRFASLYVNGNAAANRIWGNQVAQQSSIAFSSIVLNPGDALHAEIGGGATMQVVVMGSELEGVAD